MNDALTEALGTVQGDPSSTAGWSELERLADELNRPDEVADAYKQVLGRGLAKDVAGAVADRAVKFFQTWFIDTPEALPELLGSIVDRYPDMDWAFERLAVTLTSGARWSELLALYDRTLSQTRDEKRRRKLLDDAANLAKDFANQPDRAVDYLQQLLELDPGNDKLAVSLERLLERRERWPELLSLWRTRIPKLSTEEARSARAKIAAVSLERLKQPEQALNELRELVEESPGHPDACAHLERILALDDAPLQARREALYLLRKTYEIVERGDDVVRVVELALGFVAGDDARALRRELGARLAILERDEEAIGHFAALLRDAPDDTDARRQLRELSRRSGRRDLHARALMDAADAATDEAQKVPLWLSAADVKRTLDDAEGAIALYRLVLGSNGADPNEATQAAHRLNELLAAQERNDERLDVLEQLSVLERSPSFQRQIRAEAARLAARLGDNDRALANWTTVANSDRNDGEALSAVIELLERMERVPDLVASLEARSNAAGSPAARRADLVHMATLQSEQLGQPEAAIATWFVIRDEFGEDRECLAALDALMSESEQWEELAELLAAAVGRERDDGAHHLDRLAQLYQRLGKPEASLPLFEQALELDPKDEDARAGMKALIDLPICAKRAGDALARAYERAEEWPKILEILAPRLGASKDAGERADLYHQAAQLYDSRMDQPAAALQSLARALPLAPYRRDIRAGLLRLGDATGSRAEVAEALRDAAQQLSGDDASAAAELLRVEATLQETKLDDWASAFEARRAICELVPEDVIATQDVARAAARAGRWKEAAVATVEAVRQLGRVEGGLLTALDAAARAIDAWDDLADAMSAALARHGTELPAELAAQLHRRVADWYLGECDDSDKAASAARNAVELAPEDLGTLELLVRLQRLDPGPELAQALLRVDRAGDERSLDALHEAAELAIGDSDKRRTRTVLERLFRKAANLWLAGESASGTKGAPEAASWALDQLVDNLLASDERERAAREIIGGVSLPFDAKRRAELSLRAAGLLVSIGDRVRAIDAYRTALSAVPDDLPTIRTLATLLEDEEKKTGSVALRERELSLTDDEGARLFLRLESSKRAAVTEKKSGRVESLLANLEEHPGHRESIDALAPVLSERGRQAELADVLDKQARTLEQRGESARAAELWTWAARVAEKDLGDRARAIAAHERVVEIARSDAATAGTNESLDALARLHLDSGAASEAAKWLRRRLDASQPKERVAVLLRLARTQQQAGHEGEAVATLGTAFAEAPQSAEVRKLLISLLRTRGDWAALARVLATAVEHTTDPQLVLAYAREAADIYNDRLEKVDQAVPVLRRAVELEPGDKRLRRLLGEGLCAIGELDEARALLTRLVEDYGRRGSKERAEAHLLLANVLSAQDEWEPAMEQLDTASKMDPDNVLILRTVAELARKAGQLERAEAALRTLLLTARRLQAANEKVLVGTTEVLFELSSIATQRGQTDQAAELAESAIEALAENEAHAPKLQAKLRERGEVDLLVRLLDARLAYTESPFRRGQILGEKAQVLAARPGSGAAALDARFAAIDADPGSPLHHEGAREAAREHGKLDDYVSLLDRSLAKARRDTDAIVRCELLLRLGEVYEKDKNDVDKAAELYEQAMATDVRKVDVLRAQARVAGLRGDEEEQLRILNHLASLGEDQVETRADALYRMAEVQLAAADSLDNGLESLRKALADHPKLERACNVLRRATEQNPGHDGLLDAYEHVARDSGDDRILIDYFERRAAHRAATTDHVREAVMKALDMAEHDRAERLMQRAVEIGRTTADGMYAVDWALLGLAQRCKDKGDADGAVRWLEEAGEFADPDRLYALGREIAELASSGSGAGDPRLAAKLFERLRERDPTAREAWQPLVEIYRKLGEIGALERVVRETMDGLQDAADRNALRVELGRALLSDAARADEAVSVLREALIDDPTHEDALNLLLGHLERTGRQEEIVGVLGDQLAIAKERGEAVAVQRIALKLGAMLEPTEAAEVYKGALRFGDDARILATLLELLGSHAEPAERAALSERLLGLLEGEEAAVLAMQLADLYSHMNDVEGERRALIAGVERAPDDTKLIKRMEIHYREQNDFVGLADILAASAAAAPDAKKKLKLLREAAVICRDQLGDPRKAVSMLQQAAEIAPTDTDLAIELATSQAANADPDAALDTLNASIEKTFGEDEMKLLRARALLHAGSARIEEAVADLEQAYGIDPEAVASDLLSLLNEKRAAMASAGNSEEERTITLRSVDLLVAHGSRDEAAQLLAEWTARAPDDVDALRRARDMDAHDQRWDSLATACGRLIHVESGEEQVASAAMLLEAYTHLGTPELAREPIEKVWAQQPDNAQVRAEVRRLYEAIGAHRELANLLIAEAAAISDVTEKASYLRWGGEALLSVGDIEAATTALTQLLEILPEDAQARCLLADSHTLSGHYDEAHALLDEAINSTRRASPDMALYHQRKAYVAQAQGDVAVQLESMKKAHHANRKNGRIAAELADLAEQLEDWDLALATLRIIPTIDDGECPITPALALVRQGRIAVRQGDLKRAKLCARRASLADPESPDVQAFVAEVGD